ncbi:alkanesulfonate monooxygenase SsuD/methylene tetrahydromethanopterin reductase-like flavin-dependent oxidoreductase (luciferase family) [Krasilnikovia cinnamomea]|uniref:Alkanesulfonate monooxygenase SsuD/methylene tetrahydromethanopterin reductase-like flavin-dependent oxidoreductase (Luciferase family) n=1 Tax=Krasilnikovia cinnamomea TaxID=349313 RepID=A0A4Q7ZR53_9ACTN|nr:LLM class flavin-dependent oxidoreductase [Krasilnikovia cinnamomea]RZU53622.1 alkanesulfonate monooxygenase SsuD/methylene tetrahydromethanopterin reductase-like flavin-dependent oxidoreductase (luciferase family) [Krasilnikovia cinnamomea]
MSSIGVMLPRDLPAEQVLTFARRAEQLGFDQLWVVEDLGFRGGVAQAGAVLAATAHITVGIGIMPAGARNAAFAAMELATLAQLFPCRLIAGIGHGMPDWMRQAGAWPASPLTLLREYTIAVRTLLRGEPGPAAGRYVDVENVVIGETPAVAPPVVLGVRGPKSITVAGQVSDGLLLAEPATPSYVAASIARLASASPQVITYDAAVIADDGRTARDLVRPALAWIGEPDWAPHLATLPFATDLAAHRAASVAPEEFAATMPDDWVRELSLAGTPDDVRTGIAARHAAGATSVVLVPTEPDRLKALTNLAKVLR